MLQQPKNNAHRALLNNKLSLKQRLLYCRYAVELSLAYASLHVAALCHKRLIHIANLLRPALLESEYPDSEASKKFASWTPTTQAVFAVIPPDHEIRGPGEIRKLRR